MQPHLSVHPSDQAAVPQNGCLPVFLLSPLAILVVGCLLGLLAINTAGASTDPSPIFLHKDIASKTAGSPAMKNPLSTIFTPEVQYWSVAIEKWSSAMDLNPNLVATVMQIESCGDPQARSRSGAMGLFQVMPYHFNSKENPYDPDTNAMRGMNYLKRSLETAGGDNRLALAGYNGGIGVIGWNESVWPAETVRYTYWGTGIFADADSGSGESTRLQEWLKSNGASLCYEARNRLGISP
jgi:hypothetical protein